MAYIVVSDNKTDLIDPYVHRQTTRAKSMAYIVVSDNKTDLIDPYDH